MDDFHLYSRTRPSLEWVRDFFRPTLAIFAATYLVLAIGRFPGLRIDRTGAAIVGASLMVASGALRFDQALRAIG